MSYLAILPSLLIRSLALRLVTYVSLASGVGISVLIIGAMLLVERHNALESQAIQNLAEAKVAERIEGEIRLVGARIHSYATELEDSLTAISNLTSTQAAIQAREPKLMEEALSQKLQRSGFTAAAILDHKREILTHLSKNTNTSQATQNLATQYLAAHELGDTLAELIENNDITTPSLLRRIGKVDAKLAGILGLSPHEGFGIIIAIPVFDSNGDVDALILAYRALSLNERFLNNFASATGSVIALRLDQKVITLAGTQATTLLFPPTAQTPLLTFPSLARVGLCGSVIPDLSICVLRPEGDVAQFRHEISSLGKRSAALTQAALIGIALLTLMGIIGVVFTLAKKLTRPLADITANVSQVSSGEWPVAVQHSQRQDEIGQIARALVLMQTALIERDKMRQEMLRIEALNARRSVLDTALARFETGIAGVMRNIAHTVEALAQTNDVMDRTAREADLRATDIHNASLETSTRASLVNSAALQLAGTIREIEARSRAMRDMVHESEGHALLTENQLLEVTQSTRDAEEAMRRIRSLVVDLSSMSLGVSVALAQQAGEGNTQLALVRQFNTLAGKAAEATAIIEAQLSHLGEIAEGASLSFSEMKSGLGAALEGGAEISIIAAEQNTTTRDIVESFSAASTAILGLSQTVEGLRISLSEAQEASSEFMSLAHRIASDAQMIDTGVRDFVREVVA